MAKNQRQESDSIDTSKFINAAQIGGIESYAVDEGAGRGVRALCVNTGGGLRYRVLVDRGLDWLRSFPGGLLASCGPTNVGGPGADAGEELGLHGPHSNSAATIESVINPNPRAGRLQMSIVGSVRYGGLYNPCLELRRTITSTLGSNTIEFTDEFFNAGNQAVPHAWLLHINFGYPLLDDGAELCVDATKIEPTDSPESQARFKDGLSFKRLPGPQESHRGPTSAVAHLYPRPIDRTGRTTVAIVNRKLGIGVAIHYSTKEFPRCANWQHFGPHEYVAALEPVNGSVNGRWEDRAKGQMDTLHAGGRKMYRYSIEVVTDRDAIETLRKINVTSRAK